MAPSLSVPMSLRLPKDFVDRVDEDVKLGKFEDRSEGLRSRLELGDFCARSGLTIEKLEKSFPASDPTDPHLRVPWYVLPLRRVDEGDVNSYVPDRLYLKAGYVPFGVISDDLRCRDYALTSFRISGSQNLILHDIPLEEATSSPWYNTLPSKLTIDPKTLHEGEMPICHSPYTVIVEVKRTTPVPETGPQVPLSFLERGVMLVEPRPDLSMNSTFMSLRALFELAKVARETRKEDPLRLGLLAVDVEYRDRLFEILTTSRTKRPDFCYAR